MSQELRRVLYLEDDPSIAEIAVMAMQEFSNLEVLHCDRGQLAVEAFSEFDPEILLFDVMLPGMDGVQTLDAVRKLPGGADVPVIFMTAKAQTHEQQQYMDLGALSVIVKPFDAFMLGDQLKTLWQTRQKIPATTENTNA